MNPHIAAHGFPPVSPAAWRLFLATEVIALPLSRRLGDATTLLDAGQRATLERAMRAELQRVMSARAVLAEIDRFSVSLHLTPIVLKGGVAAIDGGEPVDLGDVDLLLESARHDALGDALETRGFVRAASFPTFSAPGAVPVELHTELDVGHGLESAGGGASQPIPGFERLRRPSAVAHVVYVIQHATTHHGVRRGHLRDVMLIAGALAQGSADDLREIERALDASPARGVYRDMLCFAQHMIAHGDTTTIDDPFANIAATKYALFARWPQGTRAFPLLQQHVPFFVASGSDGRRLVHHYLISESATTSVWHSAVLARRSPQLARVVAMVVRAPYRITALAVAWAAAMVIRRRYSTRWSR